MAERNRRAPEKERYRKERNREILRNTVREIER
jgi:hypothetical protein